MNCLPLNYALYHGASGQESVVSMQRHEIIRPTCRFLRFIMSGLFFGAVCVRPQFLVQGTTKENICHCPSLSIPSAFVTCKVWENVCIGQTMEMCMHCAQLSANDTSLLTSERALFWAFDVICKG